MMLDSLLDCPMAWTAATAFETPRAAAASAAADAIQWQLIRGRGYAVLSLPHELSDADMTAAFTGFCAQLGEPMAQSRGGETLVMVRDAGQRLETGGRYHLTAQGGSLHTDSPQYEAVPRILGLLCLEPAARGGESLLISSPAVHNFLRATNPGALRTLYQEFPFDRRGDHAPGEPSFILKPIFSAAGGNLTFRYLKDYVRSSRGYAFSAAQATALDALDEALADAGLMRELKLQRGEFLLVNNQAIIHGRRAFVDEGSSRCMVRLWLQ